MPCGHYTSAVGRPLLGHLDTGVEQLIINVCDKFIILIYLKGNVKLDLRSFDLKF